MRRDGAPRCDLARARAATGPHRVRHHGLRQRSPGPPRHPRSIPDTARAESQGNRVKEQIQNRFRPRLGRIGIEDSYCANVGRDYDRWAVCTASCRRCGLRSLDLRRCKTRSPDCPGRNRHALDLRAYPWPTGSRAPSRASARSRRRSDMHAPRARLERDRSAQEGSGPDRDRPCETRHRLHSGPPTVSPRTPPRTF